MDVQHEPANERVVTMMTREEKADLSAKAARAGVSVGEFVRRSVDAYDPEDVRHLEQLTVLARAFRSSVQRAAEAVDRANANVETALAQLHRKQPT